MYWIYLIAFTFMVFVPTYIRDGFYFLTVSQTQDLALLLLGSICFALFLIQEKKERKHFGEKCAHQGQASRMAKDLKQLYSYIGEMNRKLDILEGIALNYPKSSNLTRKNEKELYHPIMSAIELFGKSDDFILCFVDFSTKKMLFELKSRPESSLKFSMLDCDSDLNCRETDETIAINSPSDINNVIACIGIMKKTASQKIDDMEMMKALASQALFIYVFMQNNVCAQRK